MKTLHHTVYTESRSETYRLYYLTDMHVGARACDEALLQAYIQRIAADEHALWIGGGDYLDAITRRGDKRYIEDVLAPWLWGRPDVMGAQRDYWIEMMRPIAGKCIGLVRGNHERAAERYYDRDIYGELVAAIAGAQDRDPHDLALGVQGFVVLKFRRTYGKAGGKTGYGGTRQVVAYCHHGYGGGRLPGGHALTLGRALGDYECDLALMGHRHQMQAVNKQIAAPGRHGGGAVVCNRWGLFCGHFLNAYVTPSTETTLVDTYAEEIGLPPAQLGTPVIEIKPDEKLIQIMLPMTLGVLEPYTMPLPKVRRRPAPLGALVEQPLVA